MKSRNALMDAAYDDQVYVDDRTIDSHIKRLRKKFKAVDDDFEMIETLYGVGYRFKEATRAAAGQSTDPPPDCACRDERNAVDTQIQRGHADDVLDRTAESTRRTPPSGRGGRAARCAQPFRCRSRHRALDLAVFRPQSFSSLTRRIVVLNLAGLVVLVAGILYLNQFRAGLIDARVQSLLTQGEIIAGAIAASATVDSDAITIDPEKLLELQAGESSGRPTTADPSIEFPINPERVAPVLRRLISPTRTRARIYDRDGMLIVDSRNLYSRGEMLRFDLPPPTAAKSPASMERAFIAIRRWFGRGDLPLYKELGAGQRQGLSGGRSGAQRRAPRASCASTTAAS